MTNRPLISVIVAAYNHERFVGEALLSIIAQTYQNLELVVLDDGSTDATYAQIEALRAELEKRFVRVQIGTKCNEGAGRTISRCLQLVGSDLVFMLDSDDVAHPDAIERLLPCMQSPDVALTVGDNEYVDAVGQPTMLERDGKRHSTLIDYYTSSRGDFVLERDFGSYESLIQGNYVPNGWLLRRSCVHEVGGYAADLTLDDWALLLRLAKRYRLRFAGRVLAKYRLHDGNTFALQQEQLFLDTARVLLQERAYCRQHGFESEWSKHAHRVFERLTPEQIKSIADNPKADVNWWEERVCRIEDLARIGHSETAFARLTSDLNQVIQEHHVERSRLKSLFDDERERLSVDLSRLSARLAALESSRSWRWTTPFRAAADALNRRESRRWIIHLESVSPDPNNLGGIELSGWAFHRDTPVTRVEISLVGHASFAVESGIERLDVAAAFSECAVGRPGFRASIRVIEDPVTLQIEIFCADGRAHRVRRRLQRTRTENARARQLYGAVNPWEASTFGLVRHLLSDGAIGTYVWQSRRIRGWTRGKGEAEALARASESLGGSPTIVEIGTFLGCSTVLLAGPCKRRSAGRVHCVDSFSPIVDDDARPIYQAIADSLGMSIREAFERNIRRAGLRDWITVHEMTAEAAVTQWNTPIDMLYLDGDVSPTGSQAIFRAWSPFLRRGGVLAMNGSAKRPSMGSYAVVQAFVRSPDYEDVRCVDGITFARKS